MPLVTQGRLYEQAQEFVDALEAREDEAVATMLEAWLDAYWGIRRDLDTFLAMVAAARSAGEATSPSWATRQARYAALLDAVATEVDRYAQQAGTLATGVQAAAVAAGATDAAALVQEAVSPLVEVTLAAVDPAPLVEKFVGLAGDGGVLTTHLRRTLTAETVDKVRDTLTRGLTEGWGIDRMRREVGADVHLTRTRAETILRTESLRVYREVHRETYEANAETLEGWNWWAKLDGATCLACWVMHGTLHPVGSRLDGHPRCRCAMVPRTKAWRDLGVDLPDNRPEIVTGSTILQAQPADVQRAVMGPMKYAALEAGDIELADTVARRGDPLWGTMRTERSMVAIREGRDANYDDWATPRK